MSRGSSLNDQVVIDKLTEIDMPIEFEPVLCKHCGARLSKPKDMLIAADRVELPQYCWVDPVDGSQLHEI